MYSNGYWLSSSNEPITYDKEKQAAERCLVKKARDVLGQTTGMPHFVIRALGFIRLNHGDNT